MGTDAKPNEAARLIGITRLEQLLDTSRSTIWRLLRAGKFPKPIWLGSRRAWRLGEIDAWVEERVKERDAE